MNRVYQSSRSSTLILSFSQLRLLSIALFPVAVSLAHRPYGQAESYRIQSPDRVQFLGYLHFPGRKIPVTPVDPVFDYGCDMAYLTNT